MQRMDSRMLFGFGLLVVMSVLAAIIALGKVQQETSYGLEQVLGALAVLAGGFAQWAFNLKRDDDKDDKSKQ